MLIQRYVLHLAQFDEPALKAADVNGDNKLNVSDVALIAAHVKGIRKL